LVFEIRDVENEELMMGEYSIEQAHWIYYFILKSATEVLVFEWDGRRELKNDTLVFERSEKQDSFFVPSNEQ